MLKHRVPYQDLGPGHFDRADKIKPPKRLMRRLGELGFEVALKTAV